MAIEEGYKDSGYAYVILFSCVMLRMLETGTAVTFGLYILEFKEYFHTTNTFAIASLGGVFNFSQAVTGKLTRTNRNVNIQISE